MKRLLAFLPLAIVVLAGPTPAAQEPTAQPTSQPTSMPSGSGGVAAWCAAFEAALAENALPEELDRRMAALVLQTGDMDALELMEQMGPMTGAERADIIRAAELGESCAGLIEWWESGTLAE